MMQPFTLIVPEHSRIPLLLSCPHSGRLIPQDFTPSCSVDELGRMTDPEVDILVSSAPQCGASLLAANFPRAYIDANRALTDLDPALLATPWPTPLMPSPRTLQGLGLVRRLCRTGAPLYSAPLSVAAIQHRIDDFYQPFHQAISDQLTLFRKQTGVAYLLDCHSMPSRAAHNPEHRYADIVLGDYDGQSCDLDYLHAVREILQSLGYQVAINEPYRGVEIMRRYGQPQAGWQALQLEINRDLYWDETRQQRHNGFALLQQDLTKFFERLAISIKNRLSLSQAAE